MTEHKKAADAFVAPCVDDNVKTSRSFAVLREELELRSRMQTAVAELGQAALTLIDAELLTAQACALVADTLSVDLCRMLEYVPENAELVTRGIVGAPRVMSCSTMVDSEALYAFHTDEPVVFSDLAVETRFEGGPLLTALGISSGATVRMAGRFEPFGVLGAYTVERRDFRSFEVEFLQSIGNVLAAAIERKRTTDALARTQQEIIQRERAGGIGSWSWSRGQRDWHWSAETARLLGVEISDEKRDYAAFLARVHPDDRRLFASFIERAFTSPDESTLEHRVLRDDGSSRFVRTVVQSVLGSDGRPLRLIGTTQDVTAVALNMTAAVRLAAQIELAAEEWRLTCDSLDELLLVVDRNHVVLRLNERARRLLALPFEQAVGSPLPRRSEPWSTLRDLVTVVSETQLTSKAVAVDTASRTEWQVTARLLRGETSGDERIVVIMNDVSASAAQEEIRRDTEVIDQVVTLMKALVTRATQPLETLNSVLSGRLSRLDLETPGLRSARAATYELGRLFKHIDEYAQPFSIALEPLTLDSVLEEALQAVSPIAFARALKLSATTSAASPIVGQREHLKALLSSTLHLVAERSEPNDELLIDVQSVHAEGRSWWSLTIDAPRPIFTRNEISWALDPHVPRLDDDGSARFSINQRIVEEHGATMLVANRANSSIVRFRFPQFTGE